MYFLSTDAACCCFMLKGVLLQRYWGIRRLAAEQWNSISLLQGTGSSSYCSSRRPTPFPPPLGMIISPPLHRTIIFQVCSYPSLLSFFMACFCPCAALHIYTVPVQYVKEVNICSVQNVISIYLFSLLVIYWFFWCLRRKADSSHVS